MTPASLAMARDGSGNAAAAAVAIWASIVGDAGAVPSIPERVGATYAAAALDMIGKLVGSSTDVPDALLGESVVRLAAYLDNTLGPNESFGVGLKSFKTEDVEFEYLTEFHGSALRKSGVAGLLGPWVTPVAGAI